MMYSSSILSAWHRLTCQLALQALLTVPQLQSVTNRQVTAACDLAQKVPCAAVFRQQTS